MTKIIDNFLNRISMYRLMLYYLFLLAALGITFSFFGLLPYSGSALLLSGLIIVIFCLLFNKIFAVILKVPSNVESVYISALIIFLLILPPTNFLNLKFILFLISVALFAMASKYLLVFHKSHIFNPAAFGIVVSGLIFGQAASWWVGTVTMVPFILIGGLLIIRKLQRFDLVSSFLIVSLSMILIPTFSFNTLFSNIWNVLTGGPILFFAFVMLTEPQTTPLKRPFRIIYGLLVGSLFFPGLSLGSIYFSPERTLIIGNLFSALVSRRERLVLRLKAKYQETQNIFNFIFEAPKKISYKAGQYLEWTLGHQKPDTRGIRRYFTIASSPTEPDLMIGVRIEPNSSTFKKRLQNMKSDEEIIISGLTGDFILPQDPNQKLAFIAGGIGITPFRSMLKYLLDRKEKRDVVLFYSTRTPEDVAYRAILNTATKELGIKIIYTTLLEEEVIRKESPDYQDREFYLSGPPQMVDHFNDLLRQMGVEKNRIRTDFFPGYV